MDDALDALTEQLRDRPPEALGALADEHLAHLASRIEMARRHQAEQLQAASVRALDRVPRLLRGPVKKIVG